MKIGRLNCVAISLFALMLLKACPVMAQHSVNLTWPKNGAVTVQNGVTLTGFKIYRATATGTEIAPALATITDPTAVTFTDTSVVSGTTYFYKYSYTASCNAVILDCSTFVSESPMSVETNSAVIPKDKASPLGAPAAATAVVQ
jgi:hypothetical protein